MRYLFLIIALLSFQNCSPEKPKIQKHNDVVEKKAISQFVIDYAGTYRVELDNVSSKESVEVYILENNGNSTWLWVYFDDNDKPAVDDSKKGKWNATENSITIDIKGNSGMITESFNKKDDVFIEASRSKRYLKKTSQKFN